MKNSFVNSLLIYLFLPFVRMGTYDGESLIPLDRTVRMMSYLIRTPFHIFLIFVVVLPMVGKNASILNILFLSVVLVLLFEYIVSKKIRLDSLIAQKFEVYDTQSQAEAIVRDNLQKAVKISEVVLTSFVLWAIVCFLIILSLVNMVIFNKSW